MYKFNFLSKINRDKLEAKKRERFIRLIFTMSTATIILILGVLYIQSAMIGSRYKEAVEYEKRIQDKTAEFRKKDFFRYRNIQDVYNTLLKRKKLSSVLYSIGTSLDSTIILNNFVYYENFVDATFISRSSESKSQLMVTANNLKNVISEKLTEFGYLDDKKPILLAKGPDIRKSFDDFQYWVFSFNINLKGSADQPVKKK